jgi:hypothetical protein
MCSHLFFTYFQNANVTTFHVYFLNLRSHLKNLGWNVPKSAKHTFPNVFIVCTFAIRTLHIRSKKGTFAFFIRRMCCLPKLYIDKEMVNWAHSFINFTDVAKYDQNWHSFARMCLLKIMLKVKCTATQKRNVNTCENMCFT